MEKREREREQNGKIIVGNHEMAEEIRKRTSFRDTVQYPSSLDLDRTRRNCLPRPSLKS